MGPYRAFDSPMSEKDMFRIAKKIDCQLRREYHERRRMRGEYSGIEQTIIWLGVAACLAFISSFIAGIIEFFANGAPEFITAFSILRAFDLFGAFAATSVGRYVAPMLVAFFIGAGAGVSLAIGAGRSRSDREFATDFFILLTSCSSLFAMLAIVVGFTGGTSPLLPYVALTLFGFFAGWIGGFCVFIDRR